MANTNLNSNSIQFHLTNDQPTNHSINKPTAPCFTMSLNLPAIRHCLRATSANAGNPSLRYLQRRWARVHDVRFVTTDNKRGEEVRDRYRDKLVRKAREEGHRSIDELKDAYKEKITEFRRNASTLNAEDEEGASSTTATTSTQTPTGLQPPPPPPQPQSESRSQSNSQAQAQSRSSSKASSSNTGGGAPGIKPLSSYVDLEKISALPRKEIEYIWRLRFASDPKSLCAVIPVETYTRIYANARKHPQFILPLPRPAAEDGSNDVKQSSSGFDGAEARTAADIHFLQWSFYPPAAPPSAAQSKNTHTSTVLFTHLAAFKLHGSYAQPHTTVTHHLDLVDSHGIVLLQGAVVDGKGVSPDEATWLLMCLQKFYDFEGHGGGVGREKRQGLLEKFTTGDAEGFKIEELMDEAERVS